MSEEDRSDTEDEQTFDLSRVSLFLLTMTRYQSCLSPSMNRCPPWRGCVRSWSTLTSWTRMRPRPPPCCAATGSNWSWSQALRIRSKFNEFQPEGKIQLSLSGHGEGYVRNKVTSCIHNILGAERWVNLYGECVINCAKSGLTSRIQFAKASYWSNKRHEMSGTITITDTTGAVVTNLFGKWSQALFTGKAPSPWPENIKLGFEQAQRDWRRQREHDQVHYATFLECQVKLFIISWSPSLLSGSTTMAARHRTARTLGRPLTSGNTLASIVSRGTCLVVCDIIRDIK